MKVFYLHIPSTDFTVSGNTCTSPVIDLYSNTYYRNFSNTKSSFGTNKLNNGTWTGLDATDGFVLANRFVDTTGRIDLINHSVAVTTAAPITDFSPQLAIYTAHSSAAIFPTEWVLNTNFVSGDDLNLIDVQRYAKFVITFGITSNIAYTFDFWLRLQIDNPVMTPFFNRARNVAQKFPGWMDISESDNTTATQTSTPHSVGAQYINALAGEWLDNVDSQLLYQDYQRYVGTVDLNQLAWAYRTEGAPEFVSTVHGFGVVDGRSHTYGELTNCSLQEFYLAAPTEDAFYWDEATQTVFTIKQYSSLHINGTTYHQVLHQVWNSLDDIGLLVDLRRLKGETNTNFQLRILDVYLNPLGVGLDSFKKALRRELNLWQFWGSTPNSNFLGATPSLYEISDMESDATWWAPNGLPTSEFIHLVDDLSRKYPNTWGRFKYNEMLWDLGGPNYEGFGILPYQLDVPLPSTLTVQPGIGDGTDLLVHRPDELLGAETFAAKLEAKGMQRVTVTQWPQIDFDISVVGSATKTTYNNPTLTVYLSVELTVSGTVYVCSTPLTVQSDATVSSPTGTDNGNTTWKVFNEDNLTSDTLLFTNKVTGALYQGTGQINLSDVTVNVLKYGQWNQGSQTYINNSAQSFNAWWAYNPSSVLTSSTGAPTITGGAWSPVVLQSTNIVSNAGTWTSEPYIYHVTLNGALPGQSPQPFILPAPVIAWDNFLDNPPTKNYVVSIFTSDGTEPVVNTTNSSGEPTTINADSFISVNGQSGWGVGVSNTITFSADTTPFFTIISIDTVTYPITADTWVLQEWDQVSSFSGVIDENGPWRNGNASRPGNTNNHFVWADMSRTDFGIPSSTTDNIVTWMGVTSDNPNVSTWIDSNSVVTINDSTSVILDGVNDYISSPDSVQLSTVTGIDIRAYIASADWITFPSTLVNSCIVSKSDPGQESYAFNLTAHGALQFLRGKDGTTMTGQNSSVVLNLANNAPLWVRVTMSLTGGDTLTTTFYTSSDGETWTQLGTNFLDAYAGTSIYDTTAPVRIGSFEGGQFFAGQIFYVEIRDSPNGRTVASPWFRTPPSNSTTYSGDLTKATDPQNNVWTLNGGCLISLADNPTLLPQQITDHDGSFSSFPISAKLNTTIAPEWYPKINAGYFYDKGGEYYLYADQGSTPISPITPISQFVLPKVANQGAPIVVQYYDNTDTQKATPFWKKRVSFFNDITTPTLTTTNTEQKTGNGTKSFWLAYTNLYNVTAQDLTTGLFVSVSQVQNNQVTLAATTNPDHTYQISYSVTDTFYADNDWTAPDGSLRTRIVFDAPLSTSKNYNISWENSLFNPATPSSLKLSPLYSSMDEGFIYISHDEFSLDQLLITISPSNIIADGLDQVVINVRSVDQYGNPKPKQTVHVSTSWGYLGNSYAATPAPVSALDTITSSDGYAHTMLLSQSGTITPVGTLTFTAGAIVSTITFQIKPITVPNYRLTMKPSVDQIPADGQSTLYIIGKLEDTTYTGIPSAQIQWNRARSVEGLFDLRTFPGQDRTRGDYGQLLTDNFGFFTIGPFVAATPGSPGYWFLEADTNIPATPISGSSANPSILSATPNIVGDIVYWNEYPYYQYGVENLHQLPKAPYQMGLDLAATPYTKQFSALARYSDASPYMPVNPVTIDWQPPQWVPMSAFTQYELGLSGVDPDKMSITQYQKLHPFKRDV